MYINAFGNPGDPVILGLHPMSITGENLYEALRPNLSGEYFVIAPDQGGHGRSGHYISREDELDTLKNYLLRNGYTHIRLLYAASMGVGLANELLKDPAFHIDKVWFDGAAFSETPPSGMWLIRPLMRVVLKFYDLFPGVIGSSFVKHYGPVFGEKMKQNFSRLSAEDVVRIFSGLSSSIPAQLSDDMQKNIHLEWGEDDGGAAHSLPLVKKYMPSADIVIRKGYGHCTYMAFNTAEYVKELEEFAGNGVVNT